MKCSSSMWLFFLLLSLGLFTFCITSCSAFSEQVSDEEAGMNGGFEVDRDGLPVNWLCYTPETVGDDDFTIQIDDEEFKEGKQSLRFDLQKNYTKVGRFAPGITQEFAALNGTNYRISFWVKNTGSEFFIRTSAVSAHDQIVGPSLRSKEVIDTWKYFELEFSMHSGLPKLRFELNVLSKGSFWIDDIQINEIKNE